MNRKNYTDEQKLAILKEGQSGTPVPEICRTYNIGSSTYYKWRDKYQGMDVQLMQRMRELERENKRLKKMYAETQMQKDILQEVIAKKL
jgi:putative transposase